jgi:hypothetical protein
MQALNPERLTLESEQKAPATIFQTVVTWTERVGYHPIDVGDSNRTRRVDVCGAGGVGGLQMGLLPVQTVWRSRQYSLTDLFTNRERASCAKEQKEEDRNWVKAACSAVPRRLGISQFQRAFPFGGAEGRGGGLLRFENVHSNSFWKPPLSFYC